MLSYSVEVQAIRGQKWINGVIYCMQGVYCKNNALPISNMVYMVVLNDIIKA